MRVEERPWGKFTVIHSVEAVDNGMQFQVKILEIQPGESISLQMHFHRSEQWYVVQGEGKLTYVGEDRPSAGPIHEDLLSGDSIYIGCEALHRAECTGDIPLKIVEVQYGTDIRDDDIERFEDKYGRVQATQDI